MAITPSGLPVLERVVADEVVGLLRRSYGEDPKKSSTIIRTQWLREITDENPLINDYLGNLMGAYIDGGCYVPASPFQLGDSMILFYHLLQVQGRRLVPPIKLPVITREILLEADGEFPTLLAEINKKEENIDSQMRRENLVLYAAVHHVIIPPVNIDIRGGTYSSILFNYWMLSKAAEQEAKK